MRSNVFRAPATVNDPRPQEAGKPVESRKSEEVFEFASDPDTSDGRDGQEDRHVSGRKPAVTTVVIEHEGCCFDSDQLPPPHQMGDPLLEPTR